jgi:hypothetical protein
MNCREFENIINDLARAQRDPGMINAEARVAGLVHIETCASCAARLADERALSEGLKYLAASDEGKVAPSYVEAALLEAFRAQAPKPVASHSIIRSGSRSLRAWPRFVWPRWVLAAAAILIALGLIVYRSVQNELRKDDVVIEDKKPAPQPSVEREEQVNQDIVEPAPRRKSRAPRHRPQLNRFVIRDSITAYANDSEDMTDFFPLRYGEAQKPMESGELIRVQMPRLALVRLGFPVNVERADAPVKADLLVGEDGLAHAIRFVR